MKLTFGRSTWLVLSFASAVILTSTLAAQTEADKAIVQRGIQSYYRLTNEGLGSYSCTADPNWELMLGDLRKSDPAAADKTVGILRGIHFYVTVDSLGKATVTHNNPTAENDQMASGFKQIYDGMGQMIGGFYDTTAMFLFRTPFPPADTAFKLEPKGSQYDLSYKESDTGVNAVVDSDSRVRSVEITTSEFKSVIQPTFSKTDKGFLVAGYDATYQSKSPTDATTLSAHWDYQLIGGFQLPKTLNLSGSYGTNPFNAEVVFSGCQATKK